MVGKMDIARCGPCCNETCLIADGYDTYDECSGNWFALNGSLSTSDSDAKMLFTPTFGPAPWRMRVWIVVTTAPFFLWPPVGEWDIRLIGGVTDAGVGAFYCDGVGVYLRWVRQMDAGVAVNYFECHDARYPDSGTVAFPDSYGVFQLCWDGSTLSAYFSVTNQTPILIGTISNPPVGDRFGFETGTLTSVASVAFHDFHLYAVPDDPDYLSCVSCSDSIGTLCCKGPVPSELVFELSGWTGTILFAQTGFDGSNCQDNCVDLNGTYYLSIMPPSGGVLRCLWRTQGAESGTCTAFGGGTSAMAYNIYIEAERFGSTLQVRIYSYDKTLKSGSWIADFRADVGEDQCLDWTSWVNLTQYTANPATSGNYCSGATTARILMNAV